MKKLISLLIVVLMMSTSVFAETPAFSDVSGHWAEQEIATACAKGVVNGYEDGSFHPDDTVTRAEFLKMATAALLGEDAALLPEVEGSTHWADKYNAFALRFFLIPGEGVTYNDVVPANMSAEDYDLPIRRWEMAYILGCALNNVLSFESFSYLFKSSFVPADADSIIETYHPLIVNSISAVIRCAISTGDENGNFNADNTGTRAEAAALINRFITAADKIYDEYIRILEKDASYEENKITYSESEIPAEGTVVLFTLENGKTFEITLDPKNAPQTCANFVKLVSSGFYNGLTFHRVVPGFVIQGGDPKGDGTGDAEHNITGEFAANGIENTLSHTKGVVSMARSNHNDSASCQFFICYDDVSEMLDGSYAAFGKVTKGLEALEEFQAVDLTISAGEQSRPVKPIVIKSAIIKK
ncbi:MAG: peptidylprolyl isomerase [Clostridia bacterium]|nr:peptidylprolyl isomerase [Clostridia bacterium]